MNDFSLLRVQDLFPDGSVTGTKFCERMFQIQEDPPSKKKKNNIDRRIQI